MNKFKFQPPQEHRRSLLPHKNQHITLTNTLDKCTQILREDRLFIRNQIKNNNIAILDIFKQYARPSQFQNLQVKLRKYVQNVKNQQKAEQLLKFKETLQGGHTSSTTNLSKRPNPILKTAQSNIKQSFKQNSVDLINKHNYSNNFNYRDSRSQEPVEPQNNKYLNHSLKHFQDLLKYKLNQDIIEERESQNVTSARLARPEYEQNKKAPLQEQLYDCQENKAFSKTLKNNFTTSIQENHETMNFSNLYKQKMKYEQPKAKALPWQFQNKPKNNIPFYNKAQIQHSSSSLSFANNSRSKTFESFAPRQAKQQHYQQRQESIFDKHFNQSDKVSSQHQRYQNNHVNQFKNIAPLPQLNQSNKVDNSNLLLESNNNTQFYFELKEHQIKGSNDIVMQKPQSRPDITSSNSSRNQENLFTPQDLLNQCRNFLKNRESTMKKSNLMASNLNQASANQLAQPLSSAFNQTQCLFNRNNIREESLSLLAKPAAKEQEKSYVFPQIKEESDRKYELPPSYPLSFAEEKIHHYNNLQTFANHEEQEEKPILSFPTFQITQQIQPQSKLQAKKDNVVYTIPEKFSIQLFLQSLIEFNDLNPFITAKNMRQFLDSIPTCNQALKQLLKPFLQQLKPTSQIFIVSIVQKLNTIYNQTYCQYPHNDKQIHFIYQLLDIDQKGYINREDIKLFLSQIQQAQVDNYQQVQDQLWRLFQGADFTNQQRLSYWHFSFVKNSEEFQRVYNLLSQFQFQIQRNG